MAEQWQPEFPNQRPPFEPGNEAPLVSGAYSERRLLPRAALILEEARQHPAWPRYLDDDPSFAAELAAWSRAEAVVAIAAEWLSEQDISEWLRETVTEDSEEVRTKTGSRRRTVGMRVGSSLEVLRRFESIAANCRSRLGLNPLSRSRLGRDAATVRALRQGGVDAVRESGRGALAARVERLSVPDTADADTGVDGPASAT